MSYSESAAASAGCDREVENHMEARSTPGADRVQDRSRPGSGRGPSQEKHQANDYNWKDQVHTMVKSDSESEISDSEHFLTKGAFLLTPSHDLSMEKAATICEKMPFKGCFSLTKTATGILFKFSDFDDYQIVYKKGFHKVTNSRFYRKVIIPCRPQKTFTVFVLDIPEDLPEDDIRHSLYKFSSIVEVVRMQYIPAHPGASPLAKSLRRPSADGDSVPAAPAPAPAPATAVRVTLASLEECNILLQSGLDFYGATYFPTELAMPQQAAKMARPSKVSGGSITARVRDLLPVFDNAGFAKLPPPAMKMIKPRGK